LFNTIGKIVFLLCISAIHFIINAILLLINLNIER